MAPLPSFGGLSFFIFLAWLLYSDIFISNMYVNFQHRFFMAHILFNVGVFVIYMLPLPYLPNSSIFFILRLICKIIVTLPWIQLPPLIAPSSLLLCNGKQFGVLRQAVDLLAQTKELGRRYPNNPHIEVMLQYYRKHLGRDKFKYDHMDRKWIYVDCNISTKSWATIPQMKCTL